MTVLDRAHPSVVAARARFHPDIVREVSEAVAREPVVVVGMAWNLAVKKARQMLQEEDIGFTYLEYGNYITGWRRRLAIKLWAGWPTFPMVFVHGSLVGGASDLAVLRKSGELKTLLAAGRAEAKSA